MQTQKERPEKRKYQQLAETKDMETWRWGKVRGVESDAKYL